MRELIATLTALFVVAFFAQGSVEGSWYGTLEAGPSQLPLQLHFTPDGKRFKCMMLSPMQSADTIPMSVKYCKNDSVRVSSLTLMASYSGRVSGDTLRGTFSQMGHSFPLQFTRKAQSFVRPQTPTPPYPYATENVAFINPTDSVTLAGTLTYAAPDSAPTGIALVMVSGSGQQDRDETILAHKPFAVIADHLARHGVASLRYDDRGVGESRGNPATVTVHSNADDARAAIAYLHTTGRFRKIGVLGHSEGGLIAFMLAADPQQVDFAIAIAGPAVSGREILERQLIDICKASDITPRQTDEAHRSQQDALAANTSPWLADFIAYDPRDDIRRIAVPTFAIYGTKDLQVNAQVNADALRATASDAPVSIKIYPDLNHLMQPAQSGLPAEYGTIPTTISPAVLSDLTTFLTNLK